MAEDTGVLGGLLGFFDRGYDPAKAYEGLLAEQGTQDAMKARALAAMAGAFGRGALPSPYKGGTPFLATLGQAAEAAYGGEDTLMKARSLAAEQQLHAAQAGLASSQMGITKLLGPAYQEYLRKFGVGGGGTEPATEKKTGPAALLSGESYWTPEGLAALRPTEGKYDQIHYPSGDPSTASGAYGFLDSTWKQQAPLANVDITKYPRAYMAPPAVQDAVAAITPIHHWTGVDANGKPFNAAAQKLAANPAYVTAPPTAGTSAPSAGMPPALLAEVPHYGGVFGAPGAEPSSTGAAPAAQRSPLPPGVRLNSRGQPISQDLFRDLPGQRIGAAAVAPNPSFAPTSPAIEAARAATAREFGLAQVPGREGLLGPELGAAPPAPAAARAPDAPDGGLLGLQIPEAVAALAQQAGGRPAQFAGPGAADPAAPPVPSPTAVPSLLQGGGARPPIAPVAGPMPGPPTSLLEPPPPAAAAAETPAAPTGAPPPMRLPPLPTQMPALPPGGFAPSAPTPQQGMAMGIAGLSALAKIPVPAFLEDVAKMPAQMAMEQYKAWVGAQANMLTKRYEKELEAAGAQTISYLTDQGKLPGDLTRRTQEQDLILRNELAKNGMTMTVGPDGKPKYAISPEYLDAQARLKGAQAGAEALAKAPYTGARPSTSFPMYGPDGRTIVGWQTSPAAPTVHPGPPTPEGAPTQQFVQAPTAPGGPPIVTPIPGPSGLGPGQTQTLTQTAAAQPITVGNQVMQKGPGYTEPIVTPAGSTIPPASSAAPITGTKPNLDKRGEQFATIENDWGKSVAPAAQAVNRVEAIMSAMKIYETGTWASKKSEIVGMLKSVGINLGNAVDDPAQAQIILKNNFGTALNIMQSTGLSRWTQAELFGAQANSANPDLWAKANHAIGAQTIGVIDWEQQMLKDYRQYKRYDPGMVDPHDFQQRWVEANPLQPFVDRAHERIGPLKGEAAAPAGGADVPVLRSPGDIKGLRPGDRYSRPGDPAGSYRTVPAAR